MFSEAARTKMLERGWSAGSFLAFFRDSAAESRAEMHAHPDLVRAIARFATLSFVATVALAAPGYGGADLVAFACYTLAGIVVFSVLACTSLPLLRRPDGTSRVGGANFLTLLRFYLIAPVLVFFSDGRHEAALATYIVLGLTDVADGVVARARGDSTKFGVIFDPLADIFSTAAIFTMFAARGLIPAWLLALLYARYLMLFAGSFVLFLLIGPFRFKATLPGKIVGVAQGLGIAAIIVCALAGGGWLERVSGLLFPLLGVCFASIVVYQAVLGWRHLRSQAVGVES